MVRRHLRRARRVALAAGLLAAACAGAAAQSPMPGGMPPPPGMTLAASAAMRFPQPVRVGSLLGEDVLRPVESQQVLGRVQSIVRDPQGQILVVMQYGGFLGLGRRLIAVPVDAMVLVGPVMEVAAFTPEQLDGFPTYTPGADSKLAEDAVIKVGLAKPSH